MTCINCTDREMPKWQAKRKLFGLIANLVKSANGFRLKRSWTRENATRSGLVIISMTKKGEKSQVTQKIVRLTIDHFTVVCSVPWPLNRSEAGGDLVLLQAFLLYMCKSWYSHANKPVNMIIYIWKTRRFVTKQGHRQSKARELSTQL